jgi:hypothetical protein
MIFARDLSDPLASLVKKIDAATDKNSECKMGSFVVFLNDDESIEKKLKDLADKEHLEKISLATMSNKAGPEPYKIAKDADVTVILYHKNKCDANYAFKKGEMTDKDVDKIVEDLTKILPEKK